MGSGGAATSAANLAGKLGDDQIAASASLNNTGGAVLLEAGESSGHIGGTGAAAVAGGGVAKLIGNDSNLYERVSLLIENGQVDEVSQLLGN